MPTSLLLVGVEALQRQQSQPHLSGNRFRNSYEIGLIHFWDDLSLLSRWSKQGVTILFDGTFSLQNQ
jgi:hypothetical protein